MTEQREALVKCARYFASKEGAFRQLIKKADELMKAEPTKASTIQTSRDLLTYEMNEVHTMRRIVEVSLGASNLVSLTAEKKIRNKQL